MLMDTDPFDGFNSTRAPSERFVRDDNEFVFIPRADLNPTVGRG
jgi:hypothetical protein